MKLFKILLVGILTMLSLSLFAQSDSTSFKVAGNCGMCKKRIEAAVKGSVVTQANWDVKSKIMSLKFDPKLITIDQLQQKIAAVGHDTDKFIADKAVYDELPGCCRYDRNLKKEDPKAGDHKSH